MDALYHGDEETRPFFEVFQFGSANTAREDKNICTHCDLVGTIQKRRGPSATSPADTAQSNPRTQDPPDPAAALSDAQIDGTECQASHKSHSTQAYFNIKSCSTKWLQKITYGIPMHCLEPLENGTRYLSRRLAVAGSVHRSGSKRSGSGKMLSLRCII